MTKRGGRPRKGQHGGKDFARPRTTEPPAAGSPAPDAGPDFNQGAFDLMFSILDSYGLGSLRGVLEGLILDGVTDEASLGLALQDTPEWKTRFAGNEQLRKNGLPVLSVAEYLSVEQQYAQVMHNYGLPAGFYDDPSDFAGFIGGSVSASELQSRVGAWSDLVNREDPAIKEQLRGMGVGDGELLAYMMDPDRAAPLVQRKYQEALVGGAARRQGLDASGAGRLVGLGITEQQAIQGYGMVSENLATAERLGDIYGDDSFGQDEMESEVFEQGGDATRRRKRLASQERANFSGSSGVGQGSLSRSSEGTY